MRSRILLALGVAVGLSAPAEAQQDPLRRQQAVGEQESQQAQPSPGQPQRAQNGLILPRAPGIRRGPPRTPEQREDIMRGVVRGKEAAAQNAREAAAAYDRAYRAAEAANKLAEQAAEQAARAAGAPSGTGSFAYGAGNALGNHIMTAPVRVRRNPAPQPGYGYRPPAVPRETCANLPSLPNCGPTKRP